MNGIVINIDPVLLRLGHFEIRWYSLIILTAVISALLIAVREGKKRGIQAEQIYALAPWVIVAGIVGARLFHVIDRWEDYAVNPLQIFMVQQGGLAIWGGLMGGGAAAVVYAWYKRIPLGRLADAMVPALLTAQIIGRVGCIINGDAAGGVTRLPWGFIYVNPGSMIGAFYGMPTHPYPVYEILWNVGALLLLMRLRHHIRRDGLLFLGYLAVYAIGRFILSFVRQENIIFWGLQQAQVLAMGIFIVSVAAYIYLKRKEGLSVSENES